MPRKNQHFIWGNKPKNLKSIRCLYCDLVIFPEDIHHPNQKFCCYNHKRWFEEDERIRKNKLKVYPSKICIMCGREFVPHGGTQKCCTPHCSADRERERDRVYNKRRRRIFYESSRDRNS